MRVSYKIYETKEVEKQVEIQDEKFICIAWHDYANITYLTAFIEVDPPEKTGGKNRQITIKGSELKIEKMVGSAIINAENLLSKNRHNQVIANEYFIKEYNKTLNLAFTEELKKLASPTGK